MIENYCGNELLFLKKGRNLGVLSEKELQRVEKEKSN
jgi:hypothetical protein